jgi:hypothetical protein
MINRRISDLAAIRLILNQAGQRFPKTPNIVAFDPNAVFAITSVVAVLTRPQTVDGRAGGCHGFHPPLP